MSSETGIMEDNSNSKKFLTKTGWSNNENGTNSTGFSAYPSGIRREGEFSIANAMAAFWSSSNHEIYEGYILKFFSDGFYLEYDNVWCGFSVRCIKGSELISGNEISINTNSTTTSNSNNQTVNSDQNIWKEEAIKALNNRKVNIISNSSQKRCSWCSNSINCTKKTDAQMKVEIISSKWVTQLLVMGILSEGDLEKKSKNPMFTLLINSPIEIELYDCPKFCSRKCEYDSNKAGQKK